MTTLAATDPSLVMSVPEQILFWTVGAIVVLAAFALLFSKRAVVTACAIVLVMVGLCFLYFALQAPFLGVAQLVVYTGAIMMLFVFVLMLVGVDISDSFIETIRGQRPLGVLFGLGLLACLGGAVLKSTMPPVQGIPQDPEVSNPSALAEILFSNYAFTLEITGCLLIIAALGAVIMTHRVRLTKRITQGEIAAIRLRDGMRLTPPPAPGNYARHNAADIPALDAGGDVIEDSVPTVLRMRGQVHRLKGVAQDLLPDEVPATRRPDAVPPAGDIPAVAETPQQLAAEAEAQGRKPEAGEGEVKS
ncbi:MAG: NADH-quinone oxidoreductase subunit J [Bifidobacteriaceae bacterium]|jgi:NADH-quinone oxidoreductase subunit J|nr:NADH-quinone oxidoreductase subunit J [Bifidobacteriaceae bacterium]